MKAVLIRPDLILHGKRPKLSRPNKSVLAQARVEISASQEITIMGPGFSEKLEGSVSEWGTLVIPYLIWERAVQSLKTVKEDAITLSGIGGMISLGPVQISHPDIRVVPLNKLLLEMPTESGPSDILRLVLQHGP
jgi:hypothetical protein